MIHDDDRIRRLAALWDLHNASDGQSVAWVLDQVSDEIIGLEQILTDNDLAALKFMVAQSFNCVWLDRFFGRACGRGHWRGRGG